LRNLSAPASPLTRLIEIGEFEAAVADALCPDTGNAALSALDSSTLPSPVVLRVSEGYAYYALCPQTRRPHSSSSTPTAPAGVSVIGIRSIGPPLSAGVRDCRG
jgi:hypothetical protein